MNLVLPKNLSGGHVNVSPRGQPSFKLVSRKACWFLDLSGSGEPHSVDNVAFVSLRVRTGNETISHLYESGNGRITILFEAFEGPPRIVRLYGKGASYFRTPW